MGYKILYNYYRLPNAYLQFFFPTQSYKKIEEITKEEWQKLVNITVPNPC